MEKPLIIVKTGRTWPAIAGRLGDFDDWVRAGLGLPDELVRVVEPPAGEAMPPAVEIAGAVITGSHAMVTDAEAWIEATAAWLADAVAAGLPLLGICFGHQLLARSLGGVVENHPAGREIGTTWVRLSSAGQADPLLGTLPAEFAAQVSHAQSVRRLPPGAACLAGNAHEANQAFRVGERAWGVQFHPEFSQDVMMEYVRHHAAAVAAAAEPPAQPSPTVAEAPEAAVLLPAFARLVFDGRG